MISLEYVNGSISLETEEVCRPFESFMESYKNDINKMFADFGILEERVTLESAIMGSVPESTMIVYESEKKNIFTKIGEMVVAIYKKFIEFIDSMIDKIKTYSFQKKSDLQKLEVLLKNHPDLKNEAIAAFNKGALDLQDVRSLKELDEAFDEIIKLSKKKDIDPKSLRGKWEKAKEKFEKDEKSWKIVKIAAATTAVISAAVAVKTLPAVLAKHKNNLEKDKQDSKAREAKVLETLKQNHEDDINDMGKQRLILEINRELHEKHTLVRKENLSVIEKLANGITKLIDKFDKDNNGAKRLISDLTETKKRLDDDAKKAQDDALKKLRKEQIEKWKVNEQLKKEDY